MRAGEGRAWSGSDALLAAGHRWIGAFAVSFLQVVLCVATAAAQPAVHRPVRLMVQAEAQSISRGEPAHIEILLIDANNHRAQAPKTLEVSVEVRLPSGKVEGMGVTFNPGEDAKRLRLVLQEVGIVEIRAQQRELREGGTFIKVTPARQGALSPRLAPIRTRGLVADNERRVLTLRHAPQGPILANGQDTVEIYAFLIGEDGSAPSDMHVRLFTNSGRIHPQPLVIPRGSDNGKATLTSDQIGTVTVEYLGAEPEIAFHGETELHIAFVPPITKLQLKVSPGAISLVERADLIVRLLDAHDMPLATDKPRLISLAIEDGRGEIATTAFPIPAGHFEGRTTFLPMSRGQVVISASTPALLDASVRIQVVWPFFLLLLSAGGGATGGCVASVVGKSLRWWRIMIGLVTGCILYWAFIFGVLAYMPHGVVLNPLSAFALSTLGGWLGTAVFKRVAMLFGFPGETAQ